MFYVHWLILLAYGLLVISVMATVLMENRQPAKTMAWILVLLFLPVVGIVLYFFFGKNTRRERTISQLSLDQLTKRAMLQFAEQRDLQLPEEHYPLISLFSQHNWALPFKNNAVDIYTDGYQFFHAFLQHISQARHHIHIDTYIFEDDALGNLIADALIQRAKEGVEVRVIYDDVGCWRVKYGFFERMREAGIEVHAFMPVKFPAFTSKVNYRNHRKLCVIDGHVGFIGGMNIATRYVKGRKTKKGIVPMPWRDTHLRIQGRAVYAIQRAFLVDWYFVDRTLITSHTYYPQSAHFFPSPPAAGKKTAASLIQIVTSSPVAPWPSIEQGYLRILMQAKHYVFMESPYFLPTEPILFAMRTAALAGIDVRLIVPAKSDSVIVQHASDTFLADIAQAGVKVYLYGKAFNHSKLLISDDTLCSCGSTNIDFRSFENNFEGNAFIYGSDVAIRMKQIFLNDQQHSELFNLHNKRRRPFWSRLLSSLLRLLSPLL